MGVAPTTTWQPMIPGLANYPSLSRLAIEQLKVWPEHRAYLEKSFAARTQAVMNASELGADLVIRLAADTEGGLAALCEDYKHVCQTMILGEELHFRRYGRYRLATFSEAYAQYYSNRALMKRYMNGLLLSNLFWLNHANALEYYLAAFLPANPGGYHHLEIGPGHGLLLYSAARDARAASVTGWDVSEGSIAATRRALATIGVEGRVTLVCQDMFDDRGAHARFDSVVASEVLEHLEDPAGALEKLKAWMRPGGRIWVNMPVNSPAPDHLYLLRTPEEMLKLVELAGFEIEQYRMFPMTGVTLERARRHRLTINVAAIGRRP
jgi:2-polyprenyl-3-methyl-5-hydroxy-6-metoxy-1,4-benzoquinol methylase